MTKHVLKWLSEGKDVQYQKDGGQWQPFPGECSNRVLCDVMRGAHLKNFAFRIKPIDLLTLTSDDNVQQFDMAPVGLNVVEVTLHLVVSPKRAEEIGKALYVGR